MDNNINFDSLEEIYFNEYLKELKEEGYILDFFYNTKEYEIFPSSNSFYNFLNKKGNTIKKNVHLLFSLSYTYDFKIVWDKKSEGLFYINLEETYDKKINKHFICLEKDVSYIDVKGSFIGQHNNSAITFPIKQKILYNIKNIYIQKIIPQKLFKSTFLPKKLFFTEKTKKLKKWNFPTKNLNEYINNGI